MSESCQTCRFRPRTNCRRYPPRLNYEWPSVDKDDWCGEWQPKVLALGEAPADGRLLGLEYAEGIADHWHQRFLLLRNEAGTGARQLQLGFNADGAKQLLDDIREERVRLATTPTRPTPEQPHDR